MINKYDIFSQLFLRISIGMSFLIPGLDRLGIWGPPGAPGVTWGDWGHFLAYARKLLFFLPGGWTESLAVITTSAEMAFGVLLTIGWCTRWSSLGSGLLLLSFAVCMTLALGIRAPINYSVFTASASAFTLFSFPEYPFSVDSVLKQHK